MFCQFPEKGGNYYLPLETEYSGFRFINDNSKKDNKKRKSGSIKVIQ